MFIDVGAGAEASSMTFMASSDKGSNCFNWRANKLYRRLQSY